MNKSFTEKVFDYVCDVEEMFQLMEQIKDAKNPEQKKRRIFAYAAKKKSVLNRTAQYRQDLDKYLKSIQHG